jgi:ketosteroid isomerase-like protein
MSLKSGACLAAAAGLIALQVCAAPVSGNSADTAQVLNLEQVWLQAAQNRDISVLKRVLSDDYLDINYRGTLRDKADALRAPNVHVKQPSQTLSEEKVRIYGNTAIVTGRGQLNAGKQHYAWRFTDVFVKSNGQWRAVSSQETPEIRN